MNKDNEREHAEVEKQEEAKNMISFTPEKLKQFKQVYAKCEKGKTFVFENNEYLKEYAGYMIEYLETMWRR